jgi:restriction system protein
MDSVVGIVFLLLVLFVVAVIVAGTKDAVQHSQKRADADYDLAVLIEAHEGALSRRYRQLVIENAYGVPNLAPWEKEVDEFIRTVVGPRLGLKIVTERRSMIVSRINDRVVAAAARQEPTDDRVGVMEPAEYEVFCEDLLRQAGWSTRRTKVTGDQGVDIVAEKLGIRLAVQCKMYTGSVGNAAVQEISAGMRHEVCSHGAVVTTSGYTRGAKELAESNSVFLLHHSELRELWDLISPGKAGSGGVASRVTAERV